MPTRVRSGAGVLALVLLAGSLALAQGLRAELNAPESLRAGDRAALELRVWAPREMPLMATPHAEGAAVEVVRGRLLRPDAVDPAATPLLFRIPIIAREPGPARVRVVVQSYGCEADDDCRPLRTEVQRSLRVGRGR